MTYVDEAERISQRAERVLDWLDYLDKLYVGLLSRSATESEAGFDPSPRCRPCECRVKWRRGNLCLACDNTKWRSLTREERAENLGVDPYSAQVSSGITIVKDESPAAQKARAAQNLDSIISVLQRNERIRSGLDVAESPEARTFRRVSSKDVTLNRILIAIERLRVSRLWPLDRMTLALLLAKIVPGRIYPPPVLG